MYQGQIVRKPVTSSVTAVFDTECIQTHPEEIKYTLLILLRRFCKAMGNDHGPPGMIRLIPDTVYGFAGLAFQPEFSLSFFKLRHDFPLHHTAVIFFFYNQWIHLFSPIILFTFRSL